MNTCPFCDSPFHSIQSAYGHSELYPCPKCRNPVIIKSEEGKQTALPLPGARDIREDSPPQSVGGEVLSILHKTTYDLPILADIAHRLRTNPPTRDDSDEDIKELISSDPIIASHLLHKANSEIFGGLERAEEMHEAYERLGRERVLEELGKLSKGPTFSTEFDFLNELIREAWRHALFTAHCSREIALASSAASPDILYFAGLFHDIGKYLLFDVLGSSTGDAILAVRQSPRLVVETLKRFHPLVGLHLIHRWRLPAELGIAAFCHHNTKLVPDELFLYTTEVVNLANTIAHVSGYGEAMEGKISLVSHPSNRSLGLSDVRIAAIRIDCADRVNVQCAKLGLPSKDAQEVA